MESSPKSLQETCMIVVIKQDLSRDRLPEIVKEEVENLERKIMSAFTGKFYTYQKYPNPRLYPLIPTPGSVEFGLSIVWNRGKLEFGFIDTEFSLSSQEELLQITAGEQNKVGKVGSKLFLLPGRELTISDYRIDLRRKKLILLGSCLSIFEERVLPLKIVLSFYVIINVVPPIIPNPITWIYSLRVETKLWEEGKENVDPLWKKSYDFTHERHVPAVSYDEESESSGSRSSDEESSDSDAPDSESGINESDSDSNEERRDDNDD